MSRARGESKYCAYHSDQRCGSVAWCVMFISPGSHMTDVGVAVTGCGQHCASSFRGKFALYIVRHMECIHVSGSLTTTTGKISPRPAAPQIRSTTSADMAGFRWSSRHMCGLCLPQGTWNSDGTQSVPGSARATSGYMCSCMRLIVRFSSGRSVDSPYWLHSRGIWQLPSMSDARKFVPVLKRPAGPARRRSDVAARNAAHCSRPTVLGRPVAAVS
mmetsp:Transcript_34570/g.106258  ORF Transcript_34570/g.106258 Transcript_34570/m.106258 type:complete len:216 (+) Transcript_34570:572-1219(+)